MTKVFKGMVVFSFFFYLFSLNGSVISRGTDRSPPISESGFWTGEDVRHFYDDKLAAAICQFLKQEMASSVVDFGCGNGSYVKALRKCGIYCDGLDGNPDVKHLSGGIAFTQDLTVPFNLVRKYDWVVCLEVGEHIPKQYENVLFRNIHEHNTQGVILSWAIKGQPGHGHVNNQNNDYIKAKMASLGYVNDSKTEKFLRNQSRFKVFQRTVMCFRKK